MGFIKNYSELSTNGNRKVVLDLIEEGLASIQPKNVLNKEFLIENSSLKIKDSTLNLKDYERVFLVGFGKGSAKISKIVEETLGNNLTKGYVIDTEPQDFENIEFTKGTHPLPSEENIEFTRKVTGILKELTDKDLVLVVICGGGSVMFELPYKIGIEKITEVNKKLLSSGADIREMNTLRKHLSTVKGGGFAKLLSPAKVVSMVFSDVPGNDPSFIASGPTVLDETTVEDALTIYRKYRLEELDLKAKDFTETPKDETFFSNIENILMLSNLTALNAMKEKAKLLGIEAEIFSDKFQSDAELAGKALIEKTKKGTLSLAGGETTVKVLNPEGKGGRNQEVVLSSLYHLDKDTVIASIDSDGWDNSPSAGAIGDLESLEKAKKQGLNPEDFLKENNSLVFFKNIRDAIITDRLSSNVSDLIIVYKK
jgi:glycerate-2-kinase